LLAPAPQTWKAISPYGVRDVPDIRKLALNETTQKFRQGKARASTQ
jgi:hypothetical protein